MGFGETRKGKFPSKIIETIPEQAGNVVLRLSPHHCELNPNELARGGENSMSQLKIKK